MLEELELMRKRIVSREQSVNALSSAGARFQMPIDSLGAAVAMQDGRVAGLEQHTAQLQRYMESLGAFQKTQYSGTTLLPPAYNSGGDRLTGGGFPVGGGFCGVYSGGA